MSTVDAGTTKQFRDKMQIGEHKQMAQSVVESLIENPVTEEWLLANAKFITQIQYLIVTEERAVSQLCGYPLCLNKIESSSQHKFAIDWMRKKLYDRRHRNKFCSDICYEMSMDFYEQLYTSPFLLSKEKEAKQFSIKIGAKGLSGDAVDFGFAQPVEEDSIECMGKYHAVESRPKYWEKYSEYSEDFPKVDLNEIKNEIEAVDEHLHTDFSSNYMSYSGECAEDSFSDFEEREAAAFLTEEFCADYYEEAFYSDYFENGREHLCVDYTEYPELCRYPHDHHQFPGTPELFHEDLEEKFFKP